MLMNGGEVTMNKTIKLRSPVATKEITISKSEDIYFVDIVAYGNLEQGQFNNLKSCFNFVREYFNMQKGA